jgi:hypothetical protein
MPLIRDLFDYKYRLHSQTRRVTLTMPLATPFPGKSFDFRREIGVRRNNLNIFGHGRNGSERTCCSARRKRHSSQNYQSNQYTSFHNHPPFKARFGATFRMGNLEIFFEHIEMA